MLLSLLFSTAWADVPEWVGVGFMYDTEPMLVAADPYINYAHGVELHLDFSRGFTKPETAWNEFDHWALTVDVQQFSDTGDLGAVMGVVQPPQEIFNPAGVYLGEFSFKREAGDGWLYLHVGSMSADMDFVAPDVTGLYVHSAFNNQYNISMAQFPISPFNSLGGVVGATLSERLEVKSGLYQLSRIRTDESLRGWTFDLSPDNGVVGFLQLNGTFDREPVNNLPQAGWQVGTFVSVDEAQMNREANHGIYGSLTLDTTQHSVAWVSVNQGLHPSINPVPLWVAGGWISDGQFVNRPDDLVVTGLSWSQYSFEDLENREVLAEVEYHLMVNDYLTLLPNIQYFLDTPNPNGVLPVTAGVGLLIER